MSDDPRFHPLANAWPLMTEAEIIGLAEDIRANGQEVPIYQTKDGLVLDGRNRLLACERIGVDPFVEIWEGDPETYEALIISLNAQRRHMDKGRIAMALQAMASLANGSNQFQLKIVISDNDLRGCEEFTPSKEGGGDVVNFGQHAMRIIAGGREGVTMRQLADKHGLDRSYLSHARRIQLHAPDLVAPVVAGERSIYAALAEIKRREKALDGLEDAPKPARKARTKAGEGKDRAAGGKGKGRSTTTPPRRDALAEAKAQLVAWLVAGSRVLSAFERYPGPIELEGRIEAHVRDVGELLGRVVPAGEASWVA